MASMLGGKRNVKIFLLYLMENVRIPVDYTTLNDMVMQTDYVMYLDFAECFYALLDDGLITALPQEKEGEDPRYIVTDKGRMIAEQLHTELLPTILEQSLQCALRYLNFKQRGIETHCSVRKLPDGTAEFTCSINEGDRVLFSTTVNVDSVLRAQQMEKNFNERPEAIYKGMWSLLCGNVNYLFT